MLVDAPSARILQQPGFLPPGRGGRAWDDPPVDDAPAPDSNPPAAEPAYLRPAEAAERLRISKRTFDRLMAMGQIPHVRLGKVVVIPVRELDDEMGRRALANLRPAVSIPDGPRRRPRRIVQPYPRER